MSDPDPREPGGSDALERRLVGIFVGGGSTRMGGVPKGTLPAPDGTASLIERLVRVSGAVCHREALVLVGNARAYRSLELPSIADDPPGIGPLGGLNALLNHAIAERKSEVLVLACDLPFVTESLLLRILQHAPAAAAVAPRLEGFWQPLCARYAPEATCRAIRATLASGERALQCVFERLGSAARELPLPADEQLLLRDWDCAEDMA